jgi:hypothetical protein
VRRSDWLAGSCVDRVVVVFSDVTQPEAAHTCLSPTIQVSPTPPGADPGHGSSSAMRSEAKRSSRRRTGALEKVVVKLDGASDVLDIERGLGDVGRFWHAGRGIGSACSLSLLLDRTFHSWSGMLLVVAQGFVLQGCSECRIQGRDVQNTPQIQTTCGPAVALRDPHVPLALTGMRGWMNAP